MVHAVAVRPQARHSRRNPARQDNTKTPPTFSRGTEMRIGNSRSLRSSFTLVELLVVVGIVGLLVAVSVPAFNSIVQGGKSTRAIYDVAGFLEAARAEAMARRTYVFVGAVNTTNDNNNAEVRFGAVMTLD